MVDERLALRRAARRGCARRRSASAEDVWIVGGAVRDAALGREVADLDLAVAGDPGAVGQGDRRGARRARLRALGRVRDLAGRRRTRTAGRSTSPRCAARRSRPTSPSATSRSAPSRCRSPAASRSTPTPASTTSPTGACGRSARAASPPTRCGCCGRRGSPPSSSSRSTRGRAALARAAAAARRRAGRRAPAGRAAAADRRPRPAARPRACSTSSASPPSSCPSWRRCAGSSRARTTTSTSTTTRSPCSSTRSRSRRDLERFAGERAAEVEALLDEPLADEMSRAHGAALRRPLPRHRQAGDPGRARRLRRLHAATTRSGPR